MADFGGLDPNYVNAIKGFEGFSPKAYGDYKQTSIGYGTRANYPGEVIDRDEANNRMSDELSKAAGYVDQFAPNIPQGARAALTSLTYNAGPGWQQSGLGNAVQQGDWERVKQLFGQYNHAGGQPNAALTSRRAAEAGWFDGAPMSSAFASQGQPQMNHMQDAMQAQQPLMAQAMQQQPQASPGLNALNTAGNTLQRMAMWGMSIKDPSVLGALGQTAPERKFVQIGTDTWGNPRYGWVDPRQGTVTPVAGAGSSQLGGGGGGNGQDDPVTQAIGSGAQGEDLLKQPGIPDSMKAMVRGINSGTMPYNPGQIMRQPYGRPLLALLNQYEPGADLTGRQAGAKDWATKSNEIVRRGSQAAEHGGELVDTFSALHNSDYPMLNAVKNFGSEQTGGGAVTSAKQNVTAVANEMGAFVRGNGGSDSSFKEWKDNFPINGSPEQQRASIGMLSKLWGDTMSELEQKRQRAIGPYQSAQKGPLLSPRAQAAIQKMQDFADSGNAAQPNAAPTISNIRQIR